MKDFYKRFATSVFIVAAVVGTFVLRELVDIRFMYILTYFFALCGTFEMVRALGDRLTFFSKCVAIAYALTMSPVFAFFGASAVAALTVAAGILMLLTTVFEFEKTSIEHLACGYLALFYPTVLLIPMHMANLLGEHALLALVLIFSVATVSDVFAYIIGSIFKGPKLCVKLSPKKTISGAIGGLFGGVIAAIAVWGIYFKGSLFEDNVAVEVVVFALIGLFGGFFTECGDIIEGAIKRKLDIKDMGRLLPGHGGILDRIDGNMLCSTFIYLVFAFISG